MDTQKRLPDETERQTRERGSTTRLVRVAIPFATRLYFTPNWSLDTLPDIGRRMEEDEVRRGLAISYVEQTATDGSPSGAMEMRIVRCDGNALSATPAPGDIHGYGQETERGNAWITLERADAGRMRMFLAFNAC